MSIPKTPITTKFIGDEIYGGGYEYYDADGETLDDDQISRDLTEFYEMKKMQSECDHLIDDEIARSGQKYYKRCLKCGAKL